MNFKNLLDITLGPRRIFHVTECSICGFEETYYKEPETMEFIGRACANCHSIQRFNFNKSKKDFKD
uniref:Uncharacterized protein n=1 Tax=Anaerobacillus isosaccharinicus TaxID=1532552 RepID=A0A1S2MFH0_9BACI